MEEKEESHWTPLGLLIFYLLENDEVRYTNKDYIFTVECKDYNKWKNKVYNKIKHSDKYKLELIKNETQIKTFRIIL